MRNPAPPLHKGDPYTGAVTRPTSWRNALFAVFFLVGFSFAGWMARIPHVRDRLGIEVDQVGYLLLAIAAGSVIGFLMASWLVHRFGTHRLTPAGLAFVGGGLAIAGWAAEAGSTPVVLIGFIITGNFISVTNVAMNTSASANERVLGKPIMPIYHAFYSIGTVSGAGLGALCEALKIDLGIQSTLVFGILLVVAFTTRRFIVAEVIDEENPVTMRDRLRVWREPATLLLGVLVLGSSLMEGSANDWLALLMVDGHGFSNAQGAVLFAVFLGCMTVGRLVGVVVLARLGRVVALRLTLGMSVIGLATVLLVDVPWLVVAGVVVWGFGTSLAFPVAMSAAGDDPRLGPARVATVSSIGYLAMIAGPPIIGTLAAAGSLRQAMLILLVFGAVSWLLTPFARENRLSGVRP